MSLMTPAANAVRLVARRAPPLLLVLQGLLFFGFARGTHAEVSISGVEPKVRENILAYLRLDDEACDAPDWRLRRLFVEAETEIREALEVVGYYNAGIDKNFEAGEDCWAASFSIVPGQPVVLRNVSIEIDTGETVDDVLQATVGECELEPGDVLQHPAYDTCRRAIAQAAEDRGFFSAEFTARRIDVFPDEYAADITLHLISGPRYVFGETSFDQAVLDPELIRRFVKITPGEPYEATLVRRLQRDLVRSTFFDQVLFRPEPRGEPHFDVPIRVELTPGKRWQYDAGVGYATDLGPKFRLGILNRRVNKRGHQIEGELDVSRVIQEVGLSYQIPLDRPRNWFTIDTGYKIEDNDSFESHLFTAGIQRVQKRDNGWIRSLFVDLRLEDYETGVFDDGYSTLVTPGIGYAFVSEDYPPRPLAGHRTNLQARGAAEALLSDTSFVQLYGNTKWVFSLWPGARFLTRAEVGYTLIDKLATLPASVRFFTGGDVSVRGYEYKSLGPTDPFGAVVGGENLLVGSVEIDQRIAASWSVAAFIDSGNAFDDLNNFDPATGVGAGIRWFSVLGPIRFDIAIPLENDAPDSYRIHITLGPDL